MKNLYKGALLAALGLASIPVAQAATYPAGELLVGFTAQSGNDTIYDLGSESSILASAIAAGGGAYGGGTVSWNLSSLLGGYTLSGVNWGVIGNEVNSGTPRTAYTTVAVGNTPNTFTGNSAFSKINTATVSIYNNFSAAGSGQSLSIVNTDPNSWNSQTLNPSLTTQYQNTWENPNVTGVASADFYSVLNNGTDGTQLGTFSLSSGGTLSLDVVPEPTTCSLLGGLGVLALTFRNKLRRK